MSLETALMLLFAGAAWTHIVASVTPPASAATSAPASSATTPPPSKQEN
jgi:hypothetical protein